ncbi:RND transporter [Burkholderia cenocepacia]|uniref:efflux transporter outer membrane subunit n=1 Tax=Burkholderia cenocepacia TaxID=95486 RepID=UPI0009808DC3|nr:efflux transporter outer membrane subunit [Burkholderia cenocepacia]ONZ10593.1 RND transporter [Burkholderia cenocepacia]ONZ14950.1 RND transporter [Burkholderia cenocepacia]ONZ30903.1 RND transporter [Burkholderia cenocepacia]ONZ36664.1 RND transporter [Burkholderia cenocepacia]ONZ55270.1 RND transporter [Burkholderia cenocepacia]
MNARRDNRNRRVIRSLVRRAATIFTGCAVVASCTVGPDYQPPHADVPDTWHAMRADGQAASPASDAAARSSPTVDADPDPRWWRAFGDPLLDRLVERAAHDNLDVQAAVLRIAQARAQVRAAAAQGLPDVRATASYQREQLGLKGIVEEQGIDQRVDRLGAPGSPLDRFGPGTGARVQQGARSAIDALEAPVNLWQAGFDASWELDLFGRVRRSVEAAGAQTSAAIASRDDALLSLEAEVAQTYLQLRGAQAQRALADDLQRAQRELLDLTREQAAHGLASDLDVRSADARLAQIRAQLPQFDQQIVLLRNGLAYLVGGAPGALDDWLAAPRALPDVPPAVPVGLPSTLARRRPDIRRAEAELHAATADVGVAVAQFYPDISLTGQVGLRASHVRELAHWSHLFYSFGPAISLPIFSGGQLVSNLRLSQARQAEAALAYRQAVLVALRDVDNALAVYRTDQARAAALDDAVKAEQGALDLARDRYRKGLSPFLDVLDAERQWSEGRQQAQQGALQTTTDLVALYKALGGGWQVEPGANANPDAGTARAQ